MLRAGLGVGDTKAPAMLQRRHGFPRRLDLGCIDLGEEYAGLDAALGRISPQGAMISECP